MMGTVARGHRGKWILGGYEEFGGNGHLGQMGNLG